MKNKNNIYRKHTKSYFDKWYKEYQNFMEWENAPNYKLKFYYSKEYCSSYYKKDKNKIVIDNNAAQIVKEIFNLYINGVSQTKIA